MKSLRNAAFTKGLLIVSVAVSGLVLQGCGKSSPPAGAKQPQSEQIKPDLSQRQAVMAVESAVANIDAMVNGGGYQSWTAEQVVEKTVPLMNSAQSAATGEAAGAAPSFTYVAGQVSEPWQVVIRAEGNAVHVEAYGSSTGEPLEKRTVSVQ